MTRNSNSTFENANFLGPSMVEIKLMREKEGIFHGYFCITAWQGK